MFMQPPSPPNNSSLQQSRRGSNKQISPIATNESSRNSVQSNEGLLSKSLGETNFHRASSDTFCIKYSGYLLKRSNQPHRPVNISQLSDSNISVTASASTKYETKSSVDGISSLPFPIPISNWDKTEYCSDANNSVQENAISEQTKPLHHNLSDLPESHGKALTFMRDRDKRHDNAIIFAASFFGCSTLEDDDMLSDTALKKSYGLGSNVATSRSSNFSSIPAPPVRETIKMVFPSPPRSQPITIGASKNIAINKQVVPPNGISDRAPFHRNDSAPPGYNRSIVDEDKVEDTPTDFIDPKDGHIWRAKYCILEDGVLYFYRNAKDGNSLEANQEREQSSLFHEKVGTASNQQKKYFEVDHLGKSPMTRNIHPLMKVNETTGKHGSFCTDSNFIWEKRVELDKVGAVRSAEEAYGERSFELLAINSDENCNSSGLKDDVEDNSKTDEVSDRLILRAASSDEMNEWLFQFHRSLASFMKQIVRMVGSHSTKSEKYYRVQTDIDPFQTFMKKSGPMVIPGQMISTAISKNITNNSLSPKVVGLVNHSSNNTSETSLSHGHGRSGLFRQRMKGKTAGYQSLLLSPASTVDSESSPDVNGMSLDIFGSRKRSYSAEENGNEYYIAPNIPNKYDINSTTFTDETTAKNPAEAEVDSDSALKYPIQTILPVNSKEKDKGRESILSQQIAAQGKSEGEKSSISTTNTPTIGKYIPPHLRVKKGGKTNIRRKEMSKIEQKPSLNLPVQTQIRSRDPPMQLSNKSPPTNGNGLSEQLQAEEEDFYRHSDGFGIDNDNFEENKLPLSKGSSCLSESKCLGTGIKLGGCADPKIVVGSILDQMYIPRGESAVGKLHTEPFGDVCSRFGTTQSSLSNQIRWEIGAVSECGIRNSNEDSYLIVNGFLDALENSDMNAECLPNDIFAPHKHQGLFAIFDGHCGNHAARFAAEKLSSTFIEESKNFNVDDSVEKLLSRTVSRLDREFCEICTMDGRDWESGATAIIALVIGDTLTVANLGDSNGVLCFAASRSSFTKNNEWSVLEPDEHDILNKDVGKSDHNFEIFWQEVADIHSPSREDELKRIESANGWVITNKEIPISQLQRMDFEDEDVVEILKRCFSDRFYDPSKKCHAEPGRILHISRVCGDLAVSRAIGDRIYKADFNMESSSQDADQMRREGNDLEIDFSDASWEGDPCLPYPDEHSRRFKGDLVSSIPEIKVFQLGAYGIDEFLLLACDGLWDVMDADDAVRVTRNLLFEKGWSAKKAADRLAELAIHLGSSDNITVIVIRFFIDSDIS